MEVVEKLTEVHKSVDNNIILGDFNFVDYDIDKGGGMNTKDKSIKPLWQNLLQDLNIRDPYRHQKPKQVQYSFVGTTGKSRVDRVYVNEENTQNIIQQKYTHTPFKLAHKILTFTIKGHNPKGPGYWKLNTDILNDKQFRDMVQETVGNIDGMNLTTASEWWLLFVAVCRSKALTYCSKKRYTEKKLKTFLQTQMEYLENIPTSQYTEAHKAQYAYYQEQTKLLEKKEIDGYQSRIKGLPKYEQGEPTIAFVANLETKRASKNMLVQLKDADGTIKYDNIDLMDIAKTFYTSLYTPSNTNSKTQDKLLKNVKKRLTTEDRNLLDANINKEELTEAVFGLPSEKSPGLDGLPVEFYQRFWHLIDANYLNYITDVKHMAFPDSKNVSLIHLIYKEKGEMNDLSNYRPISLLNVDIKILTKVLANRLRKVLPTIIHETQTAVYGRHINSTVHLIRDLIDIVNTEDDEAALLFLDQEKAFDRVDHQLLYKTMHAFGIGESFISWVKTIYSNATSKVKVNGFFTDRIFLKRGVRQGCPLSPPLYVLIIELLALQLRANPNIVGFTVGGEKIVSGHYVDDAVIVIKQNQCFKEVYKELNEYAEASGAKINYDKTKGLWLGKWRERKDTPIANVRWTSENVKYLGIYVGNSSPDMVTFNKIAPKVSQSIKYWKQFRLSAIGKARVTEIFITSRLWYAASFYPIPPKLQEAIQSEIFGYVNYPRKQATISQNEMQKLKSDGGIKLMNIKVKSETIKVKWLIDMTTNNNLKLNVLLYNRLIGLQKGGFTGKDMIFMAPQYHKRSLKIKSPFYKEALLAISTLNILKAVPDLNQEKVYYNQLFTGTHDRPLTMLQKTQDNPTYGELLVEKHNKDTNLKYIKYKVTLLARITQVNVHGHTGNILNTAQGKEHQFQHITQKIIYEDLIFLAYTGHHHSQIAWIEKLEILGNDWSDIWKNIHNSIHTSRTQSLIWEQVHLNFFTRYSYNKWHKANDPCTLCKTQIPQDIYHILLDCDFVKEIWKTLEPILLRIHPIPVTQKEMAAGLTGNSPNIALRNWLTFMLRDLICKEEVITHHNKSRNMDTSNIKHKLNARIHSEIQQKFLLFRHEGRLHKFEEIFMASHYLVHKLGDEQYLIRNIFV